MRSEGRGERECERVRRLQTSRSVTLFVMFCEVEIVMMVLLGMFK